MLSKGLQCDMKGPPHYRCTEYAVLLQFSPVRPSHREPLSDALFETKNLRLRPFHIRTMTFVPLTSSRPQPLSQNAIPIVASFSLTINQPLQAKEPQVDSLELSLKNRKKRTHTTNLNAKMSDGINTAPSIDSHMLVQLLLCIGLPFLILPFLATAAYFAFRWYKAKKNKPVVKDVEKGDPISNPVSQDSNDANVKSQHMMTPALVSNSVQVPIAFSRNF